MKFFVWINDRGIIRPELRHLLQAHPEWFVKCDADGRENPQGHYWAVRHEALKHDQAEEASPHAYETDG